MATPTAQIAPPAPRRIPLWVAGGAFWGTVIAVLAARAAGLADVDALATFGVIFTSIMVEAVPFVLIGALGRDEWVCVTGTLARRDGDLVIRADRVRGERRPSHPYLTYRGAT